MAWPASLQRIGAAMGHYNFRWYIWGSFIALIGIWAQRLTVGWLAWELTHSGFWLGLVAFADLFPTVLLTPIAGVIADRVNRRKMMFNTQFLGMVQAFILAALAFTGNITIWVLVALNFFIGCVWAFNTAARLSMVPNLMEREIVPAAISMDSAMFNLARFIGPAIAGFLFAAYGAGVSFLINGITFSVFLCCLLKIRMIRDERGNRGGDHFLTQAKEGMRHAARHAGIGPILILVTALAVGIKPLLELLPGVTGAVFDGGATDLGWLMSFSAIGATTASVWLAQRPSAAGLTRIIIAVLGIGGVASFGFLVTNHYVFGLFIAVVIGAVIVIGGTGTQVLMQNSVNGAMRGRVMSLYGMIYRGGPALGALAIGSAAEFIGFPAALAAGGVMCLMVWLWLLPRRATMIPALETGRLDK